MTMMTETTGHVQPPLFGVQQDQLTSDDFYTPKWLFDRLALTFDLDVAAPPGGVSWIPAGNYYTKADDGLARPWWGSVWMNPPFSNPKPWVERFVIHHQGICLVPVSTAPWFRMLWDSDATVGLFGDRAVFARGEDGERGIPLRCMLFAFGDECVDAIARLGVVRRVA
jgi:hypothetical protein